METQELSMGERRVVEAEFHLPKLNEVELPKVDWAPARKMAADVLLTGLGLGVLAVRGVAAAAKAAYRAGADEAQKQGGVVNRVVAAVRGDAKPEAVGEGIKLRVPVLPIADYDALDYCAVIEKLQTLTPEQLAVLRDYEQTHANRATVLQAIEGRLA